MARILIVGGGARGLRLTRTLNGDGHAVRVTTRNGERRQAIERAGGECWVGTPDRLATLRSALDSVTVACWLLGTATGTDEQVEALHTSRLEFFLTQIIDTTVRGFVYEAGARGVRERTIANGVQIATRMSARNSIPLRLIQADPGHEQLWLKDACAAIDSILG